MNQPKQRCKTENKIMMQLNNEMTKKNLLRNQLFKYKERKNESDR